MKMTLADLSAATSISKPYLSLIETGRVPNPPSDEKLRRLEQSLGFAEGELISHAHLHRTPPAVRTMLSQLLRTPGDPPGDSDPEVKKLLEKLVEKPGDPLPADHPIPIINAVDAGYPRGFKNLAFPLKVATDFIACPGVTDTNAFAARVFGDQMIPEYLAGDIVIFSPALKVRSGDDCFVCLTAGDCALARVFLEPGDDKKPAVRLQPRNQLHRSRMIPVGKVAAMYRAVFRLHAVNGQSPTRPKVQAPRAFRSMA